MDAKEYLNTKNFPHAGHFRVEDVVNAMESYHQAKSKESKNLLLIALKQLKELTEPETELATVYNNFARIISTLNH